MSEQSGHLKIKSTRADVVVPSALDPGDTISYRVSHQVEFEDRTQAWVGMEAGITVHVGESGDAAADRVVGFVHNQLNARILQLVADADGLTR